MTTTPLLLASGSAVRLHLLRNAGLDVTALPPRLDEESIRRGLENERASPRDVADTLAELKARKLAEKQPQALVLGCDQVLAFEGQVWGKPSTREDARHQLCLLRGKTHELISAIVLYHHATPVWRHVGEARLTMRDVSDAYLDQYLNRTWPEIGTSVGGYQLESEGIRLFSAIQGDYF